MPADLKLTVINVTEIVKRLILVLELFHVVIQVSILVAS